MEKKQPIEGKVFVTRHTRMAYDGLSNETYSISTKEGDEISGLTIEDMFLIHDMTQEFIQKDRKNRELSL